MSISPLLLQIISGIAVCFLPGAALLAWLRPSDADPLEYFALAAGISLSLFGLFGVFLFQTGKTFERGFGIFLLLLCLLILAAGVTFQLLRDLVFKPGDQPARPRSAQPWLLAVFSAAALAALVALRFQQARELVVGPWVDSVAHTYWVQLMVKAGGVPRYLLPGMPGAFAPYLTFDSAASGFTALAALPASTGVLWFSLLVSCLVPLALYRLGRTLWLDWKPAALAALLSAFAFTFPAFLLGWGRSTVLALCVLFPLQAAEVIRMRSLPYRGGEFWKSFTLLLTLSAGAYLADPFALPLTILLLVSFSIARLIPSRGDPPTPALDGHPLAAATLGLFLALPYLRWINDNTFVPTSTSFTAGLQPLANLSSVIVTPLDAVLMTLAVLGLVMLIIERRSQELVLLALFMVILSLPVAAISFIPVEELRLMLCIPAALLAGYFLWDSACLIGRGTHKALETLLLLFEGGVLVLWGMLGGVNLFPPPVILADPADMQALAWIEANTPANARFLNQPAPWQPGIYRGVDGGYWILNQTGRGQLIPPPQYPSGGEPYQARTNGWAKTALALGGCGEDLRDLMQEANLQYIYLKAGSGRLNTENMTGCPGFLRVYEKDGVTLFQMTPEQ